MTQQPATEQEYLIPDEIARAAVLPGSYTDEENTVFPAYAWLRANNPLGLAKLEGFDPLWLVTKHADIMAIERNPELFPAGVNNAILNDQASDNFTRSLTGGTTRIMRYCLARRCRQVRDADLSVSAHRPRSIQRPRLRTAIIKKRYT